MKKIILALLVAVFSFTAQAEVASNTCIDVKDALANNQSESFILESLVAPGCGMSLQDAFAAIIADGGNQKETLTAALIVDPDFKYDDPTAGLEETASGNDDGGDDGIKAGSDSSGGHETVGTTTGGGGGASGA
jgi:hypothetical protein